MDTARADLMRNKMDGLGVGLSDPLHHHPDITSSTSPPFRFAFSPLNPKGHLFVLCPTVYESFGVLSSLDGGCHLSPIWGCQDGED